MSRAFACLPFGVLLTSLVFADNPGPVLVTGMYRVYWQRGLASREIEADVEKWQDRMPDANGRKLVVFAYPRPENPLTAEENAALKAWLEQGGMLVLTSGAPAALNGGHELENIASWLGAARYRYGATASSVLAPDNPLAKGFGEEATKALAETRAPFLSEPTTGAVLVGSEKTARVLLNRVGKGYVLFLSPVVFRADGGAVGEAADQAVERFIQAALGTAEEREALNAGLPAPGTKEGDVRRPFVWTAG